MKMQRAADESSFERSRDLLTGCPKTQEEITVDGCPLARRGGRLLPPVWPALCPWLTRQRDLGVDEVGRVFDRVVKLPAAGSVRSRARSIRPRALRSASLKTGLDTGGIQTPAAGRLLLVQPPPHAANGRRERALSVCADAWPYRPRTAQPTLNQAETTPIRTEYKSIARIPHSVPSQSVDAEPPGPGAGAQPADHLHQ